MERIERSTEVACPVKTVYNQWTQFEEFPRFMPGVESVDQLDDTHVHWKARIWGEQEEWDAEITEQIPDERICWRSISGDTPNAGEVRFESLPDDHTRVHLTLQYEPEGAAEKVRNALDVVERHVESSIVNFKNFIEKRGHETGAWRDEIHDGETQR